MSGKPIDAEDIAVLLRLQAALPDVGLNGWFEGVRVLARVIEHLTAAQQQGQAPPPSAPVVPDWITGDGMKGIKAEAHFLTQHTDETVQRVGRRLIERVDKIIAALAQQPAAVVDGWRLVIRYGEYDNEPGVWAEKDGSFVWVAALAQQGGSENG